MLGAARDTQGHTEMRLLPGGLTVATWDGGNKKVPDPAYKVRRGFQEEEASELSDRR